MMYLEHLDEIKKHMKKVSLVTDKNKKYFDAGADIYTYENLCDVVIYPKDSLLGIGECSFHGLGTYLKSIIKDNVKSIVDQLDVDLDVCTDKITGLRYINDKSLMDIVSSFAKNAVKNSFNKDSFIKAHILEELKKLGYSGDFRITDYNALENNNENELIHDISEYLLTKNEDSRWVYYDSESKRLTTTYEDDYEYYLDRIDELTDVIQGLFGELSGENYALNETFKNFDKDFEEKFQELFIKNYGDVIKDMLQYAVLKHEQNYGKYIANNVKMTFTLKQAYAVLPNEIKSQLADDLFFGDSLESKLVNDVAEILGKKCKKKDGQNYIKSEIIKYLVDISSKQVVMLMPEDFDVFSELSKSDNKKLVQKYEQIATTEEYGGKPRK